MEFSWRYVRFLLPQNSSISTSLLIVLLSYSFSSQFLPIEPYLVPYLTSVKHFTNFQVTVDIYPYSVYAQLIFTLLLVPACIHFSHKVVIILGAFGVLLTYLIVWAGQSLLAMQIMQITYGFGIASRLAFSSYIFLLVPEEEYQAMLGTCCIMTLLLPKDCSSSLLYPSLGTLWNGNEGWIRILKKTWRGRDLQILSLWWAAAYAGFSLVQNYGTNLFDAIDAKSKLNGHILAASQAAGSLGAFCAFYLEDFAIHSGIFIYVFGLAFMGVLCVFMGFSTKIWTAYLMYVMISGIYQTLACLVTVRCGRLLTNKQFILLFSINSFVGLLLETVLQAILEISKLSVFVQFISFGEYFLLATVIFAALFFIGGGTDTSLNSESEPVPLVSESI